MKHEHEAPKPCATCGTCPTCGRRPQNYYPDWTYRPLTPYITWGSDTANVPVRPSYFTSVTSAAS